MVNLGPGGDGNQVRCPTSISMHSPCAPSALSHRRFWTGSSFNPVFHRVHFSCFPHPHSILGQEISQNDRGTGSQGRIKTHQLLAMSQGSFPLTSLAFVYPLAFVYSLIKLAQLYLPLRGTLCIKMHAKWFSTDEIKVHINDLPEICS